MRAKPPLLCVFCGAETTSKEPCARCQRSPVPGEWVEVERGAHARAVAVVTLVLLVGPWLIPIVWTAGGIALLLRAAGVNLPILAASGEEMPRLGMVALGLLMPALAVVVFMILSKLTSKVIGDLLDTDWHLRSPRAGVVMLATTRGEHLRSAEGRTTSSEGEPALGADVSARAVASAGAADVAHILGEHERDVLFSAALAGMISRGEIEVRRARTQRWQRGGASDEHTGWDVRLVRAPEDVGATEKKLAAAAEQERGGTSLIEVHRRSYGTSEEREPRPGSTADELAEHLRAWAKAEPELHRELIAMGEGQRSV